MSGALLIALAFADAGADVRAVAEPFEIPERIRGAAPVGWRRTEPPPEMIAEYQKAGYPPPKLAFGSDCGLMVVGEIGSGASMRTLERDFRAGAATSAGKLERVEVAGSLEQRYLRAEIDPQSIPGFEALDGVEVELVAAFLPHPVQIKIAVYMLFGPCVDELDAVEASMGSLRVTDPRYVSPVLKGRRKTLSEQITHYVKFAVVLFFIVSLVVLQRHRSRRRRP